jgi:uncharacterized integral membrane protein
MKPKVVVAIVILVVALLFALQNSQMVSVRFLFAEIRSSVAVMVLLVLGFGVLAGWLFGTWKRRR